MKQKAYLIINSCSYDGILCVLHLPFPRGDFDINSRVLIAGAGSFSLGGGGAVTCLLTDPAKFDPSVFEESGFFDACLE